jgi:N-acetylglucosaminyl-diphospho-decaprenol L-rhamnosyltransferase
VKFSVVFVNYDSWPFTLRAVESLRRTGYADFETLVVDNDTRPVPELPEGVRLIRNNANLGFAKACNRGISASRGEYVVLLNPDSLVGPEFFERLEAFFERHPEVGIAGPRIVEEDGSIQRSARRELSFLSGIAGRTSLVARLFPKSRLSRSQFLFAEELNRPTPADWVSGACMALRRETLEQIGALDERFFMYFEDADICKRAWQNGWQVRYLPEIEVLHHTGGSSSDRLTAILRFHRNAFRYHRKHGPYGPLQLYTALTAAGLAARAAAKLAGLLASRASTLLRKR